MENNFKTGLADKKKSGAAADHEKQWIVFVSQFVEVAGALEDQPLDSAIKVLAGALCGMFEVSGARRMLTQEQFEHEADDLLITFSGYLQGAKEEFGARSRK